MILENVPARFEDAVARIERAVGQHVLIHVTFSDDRGGVTATGRLAFERDETVIRMATGGACLSVAEGEVTDATILVVTRCDVVQIVLDTMRVLVVVDPPESVTDVLAEVL